MTDLIFDFHDTEIHTEEQFAYCYNDGEEEDVLYLAECEVSAEFHARRRGVKSWDVRFLTIVRDGLTVDESSVPKDVLDRLWCRAIESYNDSALATTAADLWREYEAEQAAIADLQKAEVI